ncbi:YciI family protein [Chloroflexota bacterium]
MGTYVITHTITPALRKAHFEAIKLGGKLPDHIAQIIEAHTKYVHDLKANGKLVTGGPTVAFEWGVGLIRADSLEEAVEMATNDPAVTSGLFTDLRVEAWYHLV